MCFGAGGHCSISLCHEDVCRERVPLADLVDSDSGSGQLLHVV